MEDLRNKVIYGIKISELKEKITKEASVRGNKLDEELDKTISSIKEIKEKKECIYPNLENCRILAIETSFSLRWALDIMGIQYTAVSYPNFVEKFNNIDFDDFDVIIVGWIYSQEAINALNSRKIELEKWIKAGGSVIGLCSNYYEYLPLCVNKENEHGNDVIITAPTNPIMRNLNNDLLSNWCYSYHNVFINFDPRYLTLAQNNEGKAITLAANYGCGKIVITGQDADWHIIFQAKLGAKILLYNMIEYACTKSCCPNPNKRENCTIMVDSKTELVPPALLDRRHCIKASRIVNARIEEVCPGKVVICGVIHKKITYTSVDSCGNIGCRPIDIYDDIPFQCVIDREDATEGVNFRIVGADILCVPEEKVINIGRHPANCRVKVAWAFIEKDIVNVCIERDEPRPPVCRC